MLLLEERRPEGSLVTCVTSMKQNARWGDLTNAPWTLFLLQSDPDCYFSHEKSIDSKRIWVRMLYCFPPNSFPNSIVRAHAKTTPGPGLNMQQVVHPRPSPRTAAPSPVLTLPKRPLMGSYTASVNDACTPSRMSCPTILIQPFCPAG